MNAWGFVTGLQLIPRKAGIPAGITIPSCTLQDKSGLGGKTLDSRHCAKSEASSKHIIAYDSLILFALFLILKGNKGTQENVKELNFEPNGNSNQLVKCQQEYSILAKFYGCSWLWCTQGVLWIKPSKGMGLAQRPGFKI